MGEEVQCPRPPRGAYLVMTAARELREEGYDEGFAIIALGHALFAEERLEPAHGVPGTLWGSQRKQRPRGKVEKATESERGERERERERERESAWHTDTHIYTEAARIQPLPAIHHVLHRKHSFCLLCCVATGARAFVSSTDPASSYMFMCPYPRYRYRHPGGRRTAVPTDARGAQQEQVVGIQDLGFGGGESRAACTNWRRAVGRNWCRRSLRGLRWGVNPRTPDAPCMARMSRVHG